MPWPRVCEPSWTRSRPRPTGRCDRARAQLARAVDTAERERDDLSARAQLARERLAVLEQSLAEREGLPPAARLLAEEGERLVLSLLDVDEGDERAVAAALRQRASAVVVDDAARGLELIERAWAGGLGPLSVLVRCDPAQLLRELPVVPREELLASEVPAVTKEGIGWDPQRGELWFAGETAEAVLLELEARRRQLAAEADELARRAEAAAGEAGRARIAAEEAPAPATPRIDRRTLERLVDAADRLVAALGVDVERFEAALRGEADSARTAELGAELRRLGAVEVELRRAAGEAGDRVCRGGCRAGADRRRARRGCAKARGDGGRACRG